MIRRQRIALGSVLFAMLVGCGGPQSDALVPEVGSAAPEILLPDANGRPVTMASLTREGPAVVVFHRGHW